MARHIYSPTIQKVFIKTKARQLLIATLFFLARRGKTVRDSHFLRFLVISKAVALSLLLLIQPVSALEPYWVDAMVNTRLVKCGEPFRLVITAGAQNGWVHLPGKAGVFPECHILGYQERDVSKHHEGYIARQGIYRLVVFALDEIILPAQTVRFSWADGNTAAARTFPIKIGIQSLHPEAGFSLIDPRPPHRARNTWLILGMAAGLLITAVWIGVGWKGQPRPAPPPSPAHLEALENLEALGKSRLVAEATKSDKYFTELSRIIRQYLAHRYHFPALELSRSAIIQELMHQGVEAKRRELINRLLHETDLVKFAQEPVDYKQVAEAHGLAREIIALTREAENSDKPKDQIA